MVQDHGLFGADLSEGQRGSLRCRDTIADVGLAWAPDAGLAVEKVERAQVTTYGNLDGRRDICAEHHNVSCVDDRLASESRPLAVLPTYYDPT
jgi:hypothetical protein